MAMSVRERIREVGILKTLGYTPGTILFMILGEAGVLSLVGGVVGLALSIGLTSFIRRGPAFIQAMKTLSITPDVGAMLLIVAVIIGVASSFLPAFSASRTPILDSLRNTG
jgi:putative ABC transport system permease protein